MFNLFKAEDTPAEKLTTVESKIAELEIKKSDLQDRVDQIEMELNRSLVSEALSDKTAAAKSDKLAENLAKAERELKAATAAYTELTDQLPHLQEAAEAFEREQREQAIKSKAAADLKALPAAVKKAQKAAEAYAKSMADVADLSRHAATVIEEQTTAQLRDHYQSWRGMVNFDRLTEYHYLTEMERAELYLQKIAENGSQGREAEIPFKPTEAEIAESQRNAVVSHAMAQGQVNREYRNQHLNTAA